MEGGHLAVADDSFEGVLKATLRVGQPLPHGGRVQDAGAGQRFFGSQCLPMWFTCCWRMVDILLLSIILLRGVAP